MSVTYKHSEVVKSDSFSNSTLVEKPVFPYRVSMGGHFCCGSSYFTARDTFQHSLLLYTLEGCGERDFSYERAEEPGAFAPQGPGVYAATFFFGSDPG